MSAITPRQPTAQHPAAGRPAGRPSCWLGSETRGQRRYVRLVWREDAGDGTGRGGRQRHAYLGPESRIPAGCGELVVALANRLLAGGVALDRRLVPQVVAVAGALAKAELAVGEISAPAGTLSVGQQVATRDVSRWLDGVLGRPWLPNPAPVAVLGEGPGVVLVPAA